MNTLTEIPKAEILNFAISFIADAKKELLLTMDLAEELASPLPLEYFSLLVLQARAGVYICRLGFGSIQNYRQVTQKFTNATLPYDFLHAGEHGYKRMLMRDGVGVLFLKEDSNGKHFYYSTEVSLVSRYRQYFLTMRQHASTSVF